MQYFKLFIKQADIVIFSDYGKALFIEDDFCQKLIKLANKEKKKIIVDPKGNNFEKYKGSFFITPNAKEAFNATNIEPKNNNLAEQSGKYIIEKKWSQNILLTRGENGLSLIEKNNTYHLKSKAEEVFDVTGAGDTVISLATILFYLDLPEKFIAEMCNLAGGITCMKSGVNAINLKELLENAERNNLDVYL